MWKENRRITACLLCVGEFYSPFILLRATRTTGTLLALLPFYRFCGSLHALRALARAFLLPAAFSFSTLSLTAPFTSTYLLSTHHLGFISTHHKIFCTKVFGCFWFRFFLGFSLLRLILLCYSLVGFLACNFSLSPPNSSSITCSL